MTDSKKNPIASRLATDTPAVPNSDPPSVEDLNRRVASVRRRRRAVRFVSAAAATFLFVFVTRANWQQQTGPNDVPENLIAEVGSPNGVFDLNADLAPTIPAKDAKSAPAKDAKSAPAKDAKSAAPRIQLYASVSQAVPVFDFDKQTQSIHHVGWVESQQEVPVDMNYVPDNQQDSFKAVLNDDQDAWYFSL